MSPEAAFQAAVAKGMFNGLSLPKPVSVSLPWPDKALSPNARLHWSKKAKATKEARNVSRFLTLAAKGRAQFPGRVGVSVTFCPPDKRRRDRDNLQSSLKAHFDGIADALGVNDSLFVPTYAIGEPVKGGAVLVTIQSI